MRKWAKELHGTLRRRSEVPTQDGGSWALLLMPTPESQELTQPQSPSPWSHDTSGTGEGERMLWTKSCPGVLYVLPVTLSSPVLLARDLSCCPFPFSSPGQQGPRQTWRPQITVKVPRFFRLFAGHCLWPCRRPGRGSQRTMVFVNSYYGGLQP